MATKLVATVSLKRVATPTSPGSRVVDSVCGVGTPRLSVLVLEKGPQKWHAKMIPRTLDTQAFLLLTQKLPLPG